MRASTIKFSGRISTFCRSLSILLTLISGGLLYGTESSGQLALYRFARSVKPEKISATGVYSLAVDQFFYSSVNDLARDICLVDGANRPLPFALQKITAPVKIFPEQQIPGRILREQKLPDGRNALDIELENEQSQLSSLEIEGGYFPDGARLSIVVGDGRNWQTALEKYPLTGTARLPEALHRRFPLPRPMKGKFVRLILEKENFSTLEAARIYARTPQMLPEAPVSCAGKLSELVRRQNEDGVTVIAASGNLPLTRLQITAELPFYFCQVNVSGSNDRRNWQPVAAGTIRKVDLDRNDSIDFPESRFRFIKLRITTVRGEKTANWQITPFTSCAQWVFYAPAPSDGFTVYYAPAVPTAASAAQLPAGIDMKSAVSCSASPPAANRLRGISVRNWDSLNSLIGAGLVALAGLAILLTFAVLKRSQNILPAD